MLPCSLGKSSAVLPNANIVLYPSIGMRTKHAVLEANFGAHPFLFDICEYARSEHKACWNIVNGHSVPKDLETLRQIALEYMMHWGYLDAAKSLNFNVEPEIDESSKKRHGPLFSPFSFHLTEQPMHSSGDTRCKKGRDC